MNSASEAKKPLSIGDLAPDFTLKDNNGTPVSLSDFRGTRVILYFYPAAFTPGCTVQACDFRDNLSTLTGAGFRVLGISPDPVEKLADFAQDTRLDFPLVSDDGCTVSKNYGAFGQKTVNGRTFDGVLRTTIVVDENSRVIYANYAVVAEGHVVELIDELINTKAN